MSDTVVFPTDWDDQGTRKTSFGDLFLKLLEKSGYQDATSCKIKGAYSFKVWQGGFAKKIGLKTANDRWLNTAKVMVEAVDEVWVMTFKWKADYSEPTHLQVYSIPAKKLLGIYDRIHALRAKAGKASKMTYIPLDQDGVDQYKGQYFVSEGALTKQMKLIFEAPLVFDNRQSPRIETTAGAQKQISVPVDPSMSVSDAIAMLKRIVAERDGVSVDNVKVTYGVEA